MRRGAMFCPVFAGSSEVCTLFNKWKEPEGLASAGGISSKVRAVPVRSWRKRDHCYTTDGIFGLNRYVYDTRSSALIRSDPARIQLWKFFAKHKISGKKTHNSACAQKQSIACDPVSETRRWCQLGPIGDLAPLNGAQFASPGWFSLYAKVTSTFRSPFESTNLYLNIILLA